MPSESTEGEAKWKGIVTAVHTERTSGYFITVSIGFYKLP
jgi:hypothetical protein